MSFIEVSRNFLGFTFYLKKMAFVSKQITFQISVNIGMKVMFEGQTLWRNGSTTIILFCKAIVIRQSHHKKSVIVLTKEKSIIVRETQRHYVMFNLYLSTCHREKILINIQGRNSKNFFRKFLIFFVTLGLKILRL